MVESGLVRRCGQSTTLCPALSHCSGGLGDLDFCKEGISDHGNRCLCVQNGTTGRFPPELLRICPETSVDVFCNKLGINL